jgi:phospholipase/lecithinase/hemolysin
VQTTVAAGGAAAVQAATAAALASMGQAGADLAGLVKSQVLGKGARYVVVFNLGDVSQTVFGRTLDSQSQQLVNTMVTTFNSQLQAGLTGTPVLLLDAYTRGHDWAANPAKYDITNGTTQACSTTSPANPLQGSSLGCTSASTVAADTSGYLYADDVHPTPLGYRLMAQLAEEQMTAAGWR